MSDQSDTTAETAISKADYIERFATAAACSRHGQQMRICQYDGGKPCWCRVYYETTFEGVPL